MIPLKARYPEVVQILVQEHKYVSVECSVDNSLSKIAQDHKNARTLTVNH